MALSHSGLPHCWAGNCLAPKGLRAAGHCWLGGQAAAYMRQRRQGQLGKAVPRGRAGQATAGEGVQAAERAAKAGPGKGPHRPGLPGLTKLHSTSARQSRRTTELGKDPWRWREPPRAC